jgi:exopolysaccharide biosynthesis operon protein EpsL
MLQRRSVSITPARLLALAASLWASGHAAHAEGADTLTLNASAALVQDSNLFRLPSNANLPAIIGTDSASDQITVTSLGINFNKDYSLQRIELNLNLANYHYQNFSFLNNTANNYSAAWRWSLSPRVRGNLTTDRKETLNDFTDVRGSQQRNQRTNVTSRLDGAYELDGAWRVFAGATEATQTNPQGQSADADTLTRSVDAGVRYVYASGSQWSYRLRTTKGNYRISASQAAALFDYRFDQTDHELALRWALDGKSSADFRLTSLNRTHPEFGQRDFSGVSASANYNLSITGKTSVVVGLTRELGSYQTSISNYVQTDRLSVAPSWAISAKTLLRLNYGYSQRDYLGSPTALAANVLHRTDTLSDTALSLDWQPQPHITLSAAVQDARRSSNLAGLDFQSTTTNLSAQISF